MVVPNKRTEKAVKRIKRYVLLEARLELMRLNGKSLTNYPTKGGSMLCKLPSGETVRVRTTRDRDLIAVADKPSADARLNIKGTDWLCRDAGHCAHRRVACRCWRWQMYSSA